jgi:hypothetical protein
MLLVVIVGAGSNEHGVDNNNVKLNDDSAECCEITHASVSTFVNNREKLKLWMASFLGIPRQSNSQNIGNTDRLSALRN